MAILVGSQLLFQALGLNPKPVPKAQEGDEGKENEVARAKDAKLRKAVEQPAERPNEAEEAPAVAEEEKPAPARWATIGSVDPNSPHRMLVTFTSAGAAPERIELSGKRFSELDDRSGYLGHLAETDSVTPRGARVNVVGNGTPAASAGVQVGDIITSLAGQAIEKASDVADALLATKPNETINLVVRRGDKDMALTPELTRHPLELIRPEFRTEPLRIARPDQQDPLSLLLTLHQVDDEKLQPGQKELAGVDLLNGQWELDEPAAGDDTQVTFRRRLPKLGLEVVKRYRLATVPAEEIDNEDYAGYHLTVEIEVHNRGQQARTVAYDLRGPTGLPTEGWWYAARITAGLRDVVAQFPSVFSRLTTQEVVEYDAGLQGLEKSPLFVGVDAQYFAAVLIPQQEEGQNWLSQWEPLLAGERPQDNSRLKLANVGFRLISQPVELTPGGEPLRHEYVLFAGPKKPDLLAEYGAQNVTLETLIDYGWFDWVAVPLLWILHGFYSIVHNYGIAIILLTVVVRGCLFPLSRKQVLSAQIMQQKMSEMQPEMRKINEKYKGNAEQRARAMQELWRKHDYHPAAMLGGCLLMFLQLPIFIGLYRSLMVDVELRQAPLISEAIRWCSNLGAPDMLFYWGHWPLPGFLIGEAGWLGPYFNILPIITVALFLWQQKMFMPPPADEQAAMQQKVMQYMMIVIAFMFFKVASGLCIYFIASSLWGIAERKVLPKPTPKPAGTEPAPMPVKVGATSNGSSGAAARKKKQKGKR